MIVSEDEAKTMWCPFARLSVLDDAGGIFLAGNRLPPALESNGAGCLGQGCMAWRWATDKVYVPKRGYCGLAGKSEVED